MKFFKITVSLALLGLIACKSGTEQTSAGSEGAAPQAAAAGTDLTQEYATLLCKKYEACNIKAFASDEDCRNRLTGLIQQDTKWKELQTKTDALRRCFSGFGDLSCEDFQAGKGPEACKEL